MTYLIRRGSTWHFRFRLPDDLRGHAVPDHWPSNLEPLVNRKLGRIKQEITESLRTAENSIARARAGVRISDTELLVREARRFLAEGPALTIPEDVIEFLAERRAQELMAADDALRSKGLGLDLEPVREAAFADLGVPTDEPPSEPAEAPPRRGMTRDDLGLLTFAVDRFGSELRLAVALRQPPDWVRSAVDKALSERGIALPADAPEREALDVEFLAATQRAFAALKKRNDGHFVPTPPPPPDPAEKLGPTLSDTFAQWKAGTLLPGMNAPRQSTADEAEFCIRRFREMHGDPRIGAITRDQARSFCDALWRLPTRLPAQVESLPLPDILARRDLVDYPRRSSGTLGKHITLITAIINKGAKAYDLKFNGSGWANPFEGLKPESNGDERDRDPFTPDDLATIFSSSIYTANERPRAGQGEAAFWLPVLAVLTSARLSELAQLQVRDVRRDPETGIAFLDITDERGKTLKAKTSKRQVPLHPVLGEIGFFEFLEVRRAEAADDAAPLFPGLEPRGKKAGRWGAAWSKWFNRWRRVHLKIVGEDGRKDFHSLRHTFKDMCRAARIEEEVHDALSGHSFKGGGRSVGRRYGSGVPLQVLADAVASLKPPSAIERLRWSRPLPRVAR
ncbi:hypothetical protein CCR97_05395 [Rhodoplanes elegans]|uniref:Tyr recombinase domain-containing protein n=1 Tax=Rhodoplanes elegans TaxID=29408 RepID=A0A327KTI4_9BRAD|nr:site-specific integrase [Rhodoplanes elegans]MBK5957644.1 hypothetical protein [Rhodoplanes elegans]RAI41264.1 hypothetical protein CH338_03635 [Rhodoplanes elegans]